MLSPTCDNASANDTMIDHLAELIDTFPGAPNRTRCFAHTLNLVAKCIMRQFDGPKKKKNSSGFDALNTLADELESGEDTDEDDVGDAEDEEIEEGAFDERDGMTADEIRELERSVQPVQRVLVKVRLQ
jgi:hypothetical protein